MAICCKKDENFTSLPNSISVIKEVEDQETNKKKPFFPEHIVIIKGESLQYRCTICDKTFKTKSNCCYHKHCADGADKPYTCTLCDRKFSSKAHFTYHNLMHSGINPHKCDKCDKSFKTKSKLFRHQEIHSEKRKLYNCDLCDRSFLRKTSIKVHRRTHTCDKPFYCSKCPKSFSEKKKLINHITSHTGAKDWVCEICGKAYSIKWNLELHKRTHSRVRPYYCDECQQSFSQKRYLKRHLETHKSSIKYICGLCEKEFSRKDNLQRHIVNTHLEYQTLNNTATLDKIKLQRDESGVVSQISPKNNAKSIPPMPNRTEQVMRTESVIKSLTKTNEIINFNYDDIDRLSNKISVIKEVDKCETIRNESIVYVNGVDLNRTLCNQRSCGENDREQMCSGVEPASPAFGTGSVCDDYNSNYIGEVAPQDYASDENSGASGNRTRDITTECFSNGNSNSDHMEARELSRSPRCLLPKKVITASYKELSVANEKISFELYRYD